MKYKKMFFDARSYTFEFAKQLRESQTSQEILLWEKLRKKQLGVRFKPQHPLGKFIADFYCHELKLVIEVDGAIHNKVENVQYDRMRTEMLSAYDITVVRFTNDEIENSLEGVVMKIKDFVATGRTSK